MVRSRRARVERERRMRNGYQRRIDFFAFAASALSKVAKRRPPPIVILFRAMLDSSKHLGRTDCQ